MKLLSVPNLMLPFAGLIFEEGRPGREATKVLDASNMIQMPVSQENFVDASILG